MTEKQKQFLNELIKELSEEKVTMEVKMASLGSFVVAKKMIMLTIDPAVVDEMPTDADIAHYIVYAVGSQLERDKEAAVQEFKEALESLQNGIKA